MGILTLPVSCRSCRGVRHWTEAHLPLCTLRRESVEHGETEDLLGEKRIGKTVRVLFHKLCTVHWIVSTSNMVTYKSFFLSMVQ